MRKSITCLAVTGVLLALQLALASTALAHAELSSSDPAAGARVAALPDVAKLTFTEAVGKPAALEVTDPAGTEVTTGDVEVVDNTMTRSIDAGADPVKGSYTISYQVLSADGHPVSGSLTFTVTTGRAVTSTPATAPTEAESGAGAGVVIALVAGFLVALGVAVAGVGRLVRGSSDA